MDSIQNDSTTSQRTAISSSAADKDPSSSAIIPVNSSVRQATTGVLGSESISNRGFSLQSRCKRRSCCSERLRNVMKFIVTFLVGVGAGTFGGPSLINVINNDSLPNPMINSTVNYNASASTEGYHSWNISSTGIDNAWNVSTTASAASSDSSSTGTGAFGLTSSSTDGSTGGASSSIGQKISSSSAGSSTGSSAVNNFNNNSPSSIMGRVKLIVGPYAGQYVGTAGFFKTMYEIGTEYNGTYVNRLWGVLYPTKAVTSAFMYFLRILDAPNCPEINQTMGNAPLWTPPASIGGANSNQASPWGIRPNTGQQTDFFSNSGLFSADFDLTTLDGKVIVMDNEPYGTYFYDRTAPTGRPPMLCAELRL